MGSFINTMEQKPENNLTKRVRRRFTWPASSHLLSTKRKLPGPTELPTMKREEVSHQLSQPFGTYAQRVCFGFTLSETGITKTSRDSWEKGRPEATCISHVVRTAVVLRILLCTGSQLSSLRTQSQTLALKRTIAAFAIEKSKCQHSHHRPPRMFAAKDSIGFCVKDTQLCEVLPITHSSASPAVTPQMPQAQIHIGSQP